MLKDVHSRFFVAAFEKVPSRKNDNETEIGLNSKTTQRPKANN